MPDPKSDHIDLSIVVPAFNEEESIVKLYTSIKTVLDEFGKPYEIIVVDDGSSDHTYDILDELHRKDRKLKVIKLRRNFGQTPAFSAGIDAALGDVIITIDADLQNDPRDIPRLLAKMDEGYDIVSGWRKDRKDKTVSRKIPSKIANWLIGRITGVKIHDYGCSLKAYRAGVMKEMHIYSDMHRFLPALASLAGAKIAEIPVTHHPRVFGKSKYGISRTGKVILDLITVKMIIHFSSRPLHLFGSVGMCALLLGVLFGVRAITLYAWDVDASFFPIVIPAVCLLFFFLGFYLLGLGILSELILKTGDFRMSEQQTIIIDEK